MKKYKVILYEQSNGEKPVREFIFKQDTKMKAKLIGLLEVLEEKGNTLIEPYSKSLGDGIFELRCNLGNNITRIMYFFYYGEKNNIDKRICQKDTKDSEERNRFGKEKKK